MQRKQAISLTDSAVENIKLLLAKREKPAFGIRVGVKSGGCSGYTYYLEYAEEKGKYDEIVEYESIIILIDPKALIYLLGTKMDYTTSQFRSGFVFINPNEKGHCGCGKSFSA